MRVSTHEVNFGAVKVNTAKTKHFTIQNKGKFPLLVDVGTLQPPFTVSSGSGMLMLAKGKKKTVTIKFEATATGTAQPEILSITSDDPVHHSAPVTVTGSGK